TVGKCHNLDTNVGTWSVPPGPSEVPGGGSSNVRPFLSRKTAAVSLTVTAARFLRFAGNDPAMPSFRPAQNLATGHRKHCGVRGVHSVAPSSIMAWFQSPGAF